MIPTLAIRNAAMDLLAADAATMAPPANANKMALVKAAITPSEDLEFADLTLADFDGSTPISAGLGTQPTALDPSTTDSVMDVKVPAGGFRWETTGVTNLPQTIFGYVLLDNGLTTLLAAAAFDTPVVLTAVGQRVEGLDATLTLVANSIQ